MIVLPKQKDRHREGYYKEYRDTNWLRYSIAQAKYWQGQVEKEFEKLIEEGDSNDEEAGN